MVMKQKHFNRLHVRCRQWSFRVLQASDGLWYTGLFAYGKWANSWGPHDFFSRWDREGMPAWAEAKFSAQVGHASEDAALEIAREWLQARLAEK